MNEWNRGRGKKEEEDREGEGEQLGRRKGTGSLARTVSFWLKWRCQLLVCVVVYVTSFIFSIFQNGLIPHNKILKNRRKMGRLMPRKK